MASTTIELVEKREAAAPPSPPTPPPSFGCLGVDLFLRLLLLAAAVVVVAVMVTSNETELVFAGGFPFPVSLETKFTHSPAFIYLVVALAVTVLYAVITILSSLCLICRPVVSARLFLLLAALDAIMLGIVASATGAAAAVGYIALKGDSNVGWTEICDVYSKHCRYVGSSIAIALLASVLLVILVIINVTSLYLRVP